MKLFTVYGRLDYFTSYASIKLTQEGKWCCDDQEGGSSPCLNEADRDQERGVGVGWPC